MKLLYDNMVLNLDNVFIKSLSDLAIAVMTEARKAEPENACCWNVCLITFDGVQPFFCYGGNIEDVANDNLDGPSFYVIHPTPVKEKTKKKK